jgi:hypothetical protein
VEHFHGNLSRHRSFGHAALTQGPVQPHIIVVPAAGIGVFIDQQVGCARKTLVKTPSNVDQQRVHFTHYDGFANRLADHRALYV